MAEGIRCRSSLPSLVILWVAVAVYIWAGGTILRGIELAPEKQTAEDYCVKIDLLMNGLVPDQRARLSILLNKLIGTGICRAPLCKMQTLPNVAVSYELLGDMNCSAFMTGHKDSFAKTIEGSFALMDESSGVPAAVSIQGCTESGTDGRRRLGSVALTLDSVIKSNTMDAIQKLSKACDDDVAFSEAYETSLVAVLNETVAAGGEVPSWSTTPITFEVKPLEVPQGSPMMVIDQTQLDTYPASMFSQPGKAPGEALDGFAVLDPVTGTFAPLTAPASAAAEVVIQTAPTCRRRLAESSSFELPESPPSSSSELELGDSISSHSEGEGKDEEEKGRRLLNYFDEAGVDIAAVLYFTHFFLYQLHPQRIYGLTARNGPIGLLCRL
jgi:hypothetical protein